MCFSIASQEIAFKLIVIQAVLAAQNTGERRLTDTAAAMAV